MPRVKHAVHTHKVGDYLIYVAGDSLRFDGFMCITALPSTCIIKAKIASMHMWHISYANPVISYRGWSLDYEPQLGEREFVFRFNRKTGKWSCKYNHQYKWTFLLDARESYQPGQVVELEYYKYIPTPVDIEHD